MQPDQLKTILQDIVADDFAIPPQTDIFELALGMLEHVGSPDSQLRDDLIYTTFGKWILERRLFNAKQLCQILTIAQNEQHLFLKIGEQDTDSVFTRSFSMLLIALTLFRHREQRVFTVHEILSIKDRVLRYVREEKDHRGFVPGKDWAHAIAHSADVLDEVAQCEEIKAPELLEILQAIPLFISIPETPLVYGEDERMATAVISILGRKTLTQDGVNRWVQTFGDVIGMGFISPTDFAFFNTQNFLRAVYFRMRQKKEFYEFAALIENILSRS